MEDMERTTRGFWNRLKAGWYRKGLDYSDLPEKALEVMLPWMEKSRTVLDVGSGCGTLALPLAREGKKVTALDPSPAMIEILEDDVKKEGLEKKVKPVLGTWGETKLKPHDTVLCANVPALLKGSEDFLREADELAKRSVFIIEGADPASDKFYYRDLYPLVFGKDFGKRTDYLETYTTLHRMGIFANVRIIEYDFDQPFDDIEEAVEFWKEYMGIVTEEHDRTLKDYLEGKLVKRRGGLLARFHKTSAVMWWEKKKGGRKKA